MRVPPPSAWANSPSRGVGVLPVRLAQNSWTVLRFGSEVKGDLAHLWPTHLLDDALVSIGSREHRCGAPRDVGPSVSGGPQQTLPLISGAAAGPKASFIHRTANVFARSGTCRRGRASHLESDHIETASCWGERRLRAWAYDHGQRGDVMAHTFRTAAGMTHVFSGNPAPRNRHVPLARREKTPSEPASWKLLATFAESFFDP
jgi:hypothetical protein